ncbi:hypothetical protein MBLNU457_1166t1 [Dothideomycetes sp. NU457]
MQDDRPVSDSRGNTAQQHDDQSGTQTQNGNSTTPSHQSTPEHEKGTQNDDSSPVQDVKVAPESDDVLDLDTLVPDADGRIHIPPNTVRIKNQFVWHRGMSYEDLIGVGYSGWILRLDAVLKQPHNDKKQDTAVEQRVYKRLGSHEGILRYFGTTDEGALILQTKGRPIPLAQKLRWVQQIVKTCAFIHSKGVLLADIHCANILLDDQMNAIVADFAGCSIDGEQSTGGYQPAFYHPDREFMSIGTEIFAIGSLLYEIMTEAHPYHDLSYEETETKFHEEIYPDTDHLPAFGHIIQKCWKQGYKVTEELLADVEAEVVSRSISYESAKLDSSIPCSPATFLVSVMLLVAPLFMLTRSRI